jgi:hypothetical protein
MADALKLKSAEITLSTTSNTVASATLVRVVNTGNTFHVVTLTDNADATLGSFTLGAYDSGYSIEYVRKSATDKIAVDSGTDVKATSVGYF